MSTFGSVSKRLSNVKNSDLILGIQLDNATWSFDMHHHRNKIEPLRLTDQTAEAISPTDNSC